MVNRGKKLISQPSSCKLCKPKCAPSNLYSTCAQIGLPWSETLMRRTLIGTGSAILAAQLALQYGVACMCNGGTHHAHRDRGSGKDSELEEYVEIRV